MLLNLTARSFSLLLAGVLMSAGAYAVTPSAGCNALVPPATPGQAQTENFTPPGARNGSYALYLPGTYKVDHPTALVIGLHGWTGNGPGALSGSGTALTAERFEFITAWPSGINWPRAGQGWAFPGCNSSPPAGTSDAFGRRAVCNNGNAYDCAPGGLCPTAFSAAQCTDSGELWSEGTGECSEEQVSCDMGSGGNCNWCGCDDDETFLRAVVADVAAKACVDMDRIYLTGNSQGGMMASWMYAKAPDLFAAYAPQSGTNPRDFWNNPDSPDAEASVLFVHGTRDTTVPHDGTPASDGYNYTAVWDEVERMSEYAFGSCNGWQSQSIPASVAPPRKTRLDCQQMDCQKANGDEREFEYCTFAGGHVWPKNGNGEGGQWGNRLIWEFFVQHCNEPGNGCFAEYIPPSQGSGLPVGSDCTIDRECASNRCRGKRNSKVCK